jgi:hypothetical protein
MGKITVINIKTIIGDLYCGTSGQRNIIITPRWKAINIVYSEVFNPQLWLIIALKFYIPQFYIFPHFYMFEENAKSWRDGGAE